MRQFSTIFSTRAARESNEARAWLETHLGAGHVARLDNEVNVALDRLELFPEMGGPRPDPRPGRSNHAADHPRP